MFSALRQLAERTVSSRSSTGCSRIGSTCGCAVSCALRSSTAARRTPTAGRRARSRVAHGLFRLDHAVGLDVDHEAVEVGALLDARALDLVAHAAHRRERGVEQDRADGARVVLAARGGRHVAAALLDLDRHVDLAALREVGDDVVRVDDLDVVRLLDVGGRDRARRAPSSA
jgi:hypothetical protein